MNSNLILGRTMKSEKQVARDAIRALASAKINLDQARRFGSASLIARSEWAVKEQIEAVAYWTAKGMA